MGLVNLLRGPTGGTASEVREGLVQAGGVETVSAGGAGDGGRGERGVLRFGLWRGRVRGLGEEREVADGAIRRGTHGGILMAGGEEKMKKKEDGAEGMTPTCT